MQAGLPPCCRSATQHPCRQWSTVHDCEAAAHGRGGCQASRPGSLHGAAAAPSTRGSCFAFDVHLLVIRMHNFVTFLHSQHVYWAEARHVRIGRRPARLRVSALLRACVVPAVRRMPAPAQVRRTLLGSVAPRALHSKHVAHAAGVP